MKKVLFAMLIVSIFLPVLSFAGDIEGYQKAKNIDTEAACIPLLSFNTEENKNITTNEADQRGCCSWHGGVCGCSGGRAKCCDGTLSPSCGCN